MFKNEGMRLLALGLAALLALPTGCAGGRHALDRGDLDDPVQARFYEVTTRDGQVLTFVSLHTEGDWLEGTVRIRSTETSGEGEALRTSVTNRYQEARIPWAEVQRVEAIGVQKKSPGFLLAASAVAVGVLAFLLLSSGDSASSSDGDNGKEL
jgi:hypothetical protein